MLEMTWKFDKTSKNCVKTLFHIVISCSYFYYERRHVKVTSQNQDSEKSFWKNSDFPKRRAVQTDLSYWELPSYLLLMITALLSTNHCRQNSSITFKHETLWTVVTKFCSSHADCTVLFQKFTFPLEITQKCREPINTDSLALPCYHYAGTFLQAWKCLKRNMLIKTATAVRCGY